MAPKKMAEKADEEREGTKRRLRARLQESVAAAGAVIGVILVGMWFVLGAIFAFGWPNFVRSLPGGEELPREWSPFDVIVAVRSVPFSEWTWWETVLVGVFGLFAGMPAVATIVWVIVVATAGVIIAIRFLAKREWGSEPVQWWGRTLAGRVAQRASPTARIVLITLLVTSGFVPTIAYLPVTGEAPSWGESVSWIVLMAGAFILPPGGGLLASIAAAACGSVMGYFPPGAVPYAATGGRISGLIAAAQLYPFAILYVRAYRLVLTVGVLGIDRSVARIRQWAAKQQNG